jgi:transporter family protein
MAAWHLWTAVALLSWGIWAVLSKVLGNALTAEQSQAISTLGILPILVYLAVGVVRRGELKGGSQRGILLTFVGGVVSCLGNLAYYGALARGEKVATVVSLTALYPLTTIFLAVTFLHERLNRIQLAGIALSFIAIWLFNIQSDGSLFSSTVAYAIPPILLWGLSGFLQKVATNLLPTEAAALIYLGAFVPVAIYFVLRYPWPGTLTPRVWSVVLALGFFLAFGNWALLAAYSHGGKAAVLAPLTGLYPVISVPLAVLLLGEKVGSREIIGILLALASVVALSIESPQRPDEPAQTQSQI